MNPICSIQSFYDNDFQTIFSRKKFRAFLRNELNYCPESMNSYWYENDKYINYFLEMSDEQVSKYELRLGSIFKLFEDYVDQLINNCIYSHRPDQTQDGDFDYVFLNNLRISRKKGSLYPQYFLRRDSMTPCLNINDEWLEVEGTEIAKAKIIDAKIELKKNTHCSYSFYTEVFLPFKNKNQDELLLSIFKIATHKIFSSSSSNHSYLNGKADIDWARLRLSGLIFGECKFVDEKRGGYSLEKAESIRFAHVAGLLGYIYSRKHNMQMNEKVNAIKINLAKIFELVFAVHDFEYLKPIILINQQNSTKIEFFKFLKSNQDKLHFWAKENHNKVLYSVFFNYDQNLERYKSIDSDYYSYEKMIANENQKSLSTNDRFLFPNKKSMKNAFKLDTLVFAMLLPESGCFLQHNDEANKDQARLDVNAWRVLSHWLGSVDHPESITLEDMKELRSRVERLYCGKVSKVSVARFPEAVNLIYQIIKAPNPNKENKAAKISDLIDYIEGSELVFLPNNQLKKTRKKNIHFLDSKTTIKSLQRKSLNWHRMLKLYNQSELMCRSYEFKSDIYKNISELTFDEAGYVFKAITNRYQLLLEGIDMRHCVSMYHSKIKRGEYVVMSIRRNYSSESSAEEVATLGMNVLNGVLIHDQCKGMYNAAISSELDSTVINVIEKMNNKNYKIINEYCDV